MRRKQNNQGSAMVIVIVAIAFVSVLVATLFMMSTVNIQMKSVDRKAKENFYSAEGALEQIHLGLQEEMSEASSKAYAYVMQNYTGAASEIARQTSFNGKFLTDLKRELVQSSDPDKYDTNKLKAYLSDEVSGNTVLTSAEDCRLVQEADGLVLKGLVVTYTDAEQFQTVIETDIRLSTPDMNLIQPADMPEIFEYTIIANEGLEGSAGGTVTIGANVYAGENGLTLDAGADWIFDQAGRLVVNGDIKIPRTASVSAVSEMDLWAKELQISGGTLNALGRTYVSNDLIMSGQGSEVTLEGEYYGYGNGQPLTDAGVTLSTGGDSSAILINGTRTSLDMTNIRKLLLAGSAQIATGKLDYDSDEFENLFPEHDPSLDTKVKPTVLKGGVYKLESVGVDKLVCSMERYLTAGTELSAEIGEDSPERFTLVNNSDGTVSLKDRRQGKYVSVQKENSGILAATADTISPQEKFYLFLIEGQPEFYALKSYATGKYVTVENCSMADGTYVENALCANRDKVTDRYQLFRIKRIGSVQDEPITNLDTVVTFTVNNTSNMVVSFAAPGWMENTSSQDVWAKITYSDSSFPGGYRTVDMPITDGGQRAICPIMTGSGWDAVEYTITYSLKDGTVKSIGPYIYNPEGKTVIGVGNSSAMNGTLANGVYTWLNTQKSMYGTVQANGEGVIDFSTPEADYSDSNPDVRFILVNNDDGTVCLRVVSEKAKYKYLSVQPDGTLKATADKPGVNEKFKLVFVPDQGTSVYWLQTSEEGNGKGKAVVPDAVKGTTLKSMSDVRWDYGSWYFFQWIGYTDKTGPIDPGEDVTPNDNPIVSMKYYTETSAVTDFTSPHWNGAAAEKVTMFYEVNNKEVQTVNPMPVSNLHGKYIVEGLKHLDRVTYWFQYSYVKDGQTYNTYTQEYVYIHETLYGDPVHVSGDNENVNLGESLEVKSNQVAYLVPPECIGVSNGETIVGKNPLTAEEFTRLMTNTANPERYPNYEVVSFTKEVEGLGKTLDAYRTPGTEGYRTIFVQTAEGTMVYFYVDFDSDGASQYFRDYYAVHQSTLEQYMKPYINEIQLSGYFARLTADGNLVYSANDNSGSIYVKSNEGHGAYLSQTEKNGLQTEITGFHKRFKALSSKLILDYTDLTPAEKNRDLFDNLICYSEDPADPDSHAFAGIAESNIPITYSAMDAEGHSVKALAVNNKNSGVYRYNGDGDKEVCLILATGDVVLEQDFEGIVIARGTVSVADNTVNSITVNKEKLNRILQAKLDPADDASETILGHFFRDADSYVLEDGGTGTAPGEEDYISFAELITYEEWTKR